MYHIIIMCTFVRDSRITIGILSFTNGWSRNLPLLATPTRRRARHCRSRERLRACLMGPAWIKTPSSFFS